MRGARPRRRHIGGNMGGMASDQPSELFARSAQQDAGPAPGAPLADRMRPRSLSEVVGQEHLVGPGAPLRTLIESGRLPSLVLWGPPGVGKTTLARLVAKASPAGGVRFVAHSAVMAGLKEVRAVLQDAKHARRTGQRTLFFLDEIHRFNRAQQDALLPHVESGAITLVGATTENPSFEVIGPLLSRCRVFTLKRLAPEDIAVLLGRACEEAQRGLGKTDVDAEALRALADAADGDARRALGMLETAVAFHRERGAQGALDLETLREAIGDKMLLYDRDREEHYNTISAFIKSMRASDPDAALYYLARMLEGGEDPLFIARRLVIFASEDVGNAEPAGLPLALAAYQAVERIGLPEGRIPLAQAVTFLAGAPKSNRSYVSLSRAVKAVQESGALPVPMHLRNAPTRLMKAEGYGRGYHYPHNSEDAFAPGRNLPEGVDSTPFYEPSERGAEAAIAERMREWERRREAEEEEEADGD